jgi:sugar phosphate isomerase/epimerase
MKISFTTLACPDWNFEKILAEARRLGYQGVEIRGLEGEMRADRMPVFFAENAEATKKQFSDNGLSICGFGSSATFHDAAKFDDAVAEGKAAVDVCVRMGIPGVRIFGDKVENASELAQVQERIRKGIRTVCEYARGKNVGVWIEIHGNFNTLENVMPIAEGLSDCPEFGILWDIGNSDTSYGDNWREFYAATKPYIRHTHIKDHKRAGGATLGCPPGEGDVPVADIVNALRQDGYDGWYSFEWEKKWQPELAEPEEVLPGYIEFMRKLLS